MVSALLLQEDSKETFPKSIITFLSGSGSRNCAQRSLPTCPPHSQSENELKISEAMASQIKEVTFFSGKAAKEQSKKSSSGQTLTILVSTSIVDIHIQKLKYVKKTTQKAKHTEEIISLHFYRFYKQLENLPKSNKKKREKARGRERRSEVLPDYIF